MAIQNWQKSHFLKPSTNVDIIQRSITIMKSPVPSKVDSLERLAANIQITSVIDVGVRECTSELIHAFPSIKHYLFEPVTSFFPRIEKNYRNISYELFPLALSDQSGQIYLIQSSLEGDGCVTHSKISKVAMNPDGKKIISCEEVSVSRFDEIRALDSIIPNYLLKIDVDGQDLNVVKGFGDKIKDASVVVIECTYVSAVERIGYLQASGFVLFDLVDFVHYGPSLYQFDAIMLRKDLVNPTIRPAISDFKPELWSPLNLRK